MSCIIAESVKAGDYTGLAELVVLAWQNDTTQELDWHNTQANICGDPAWRLLEMWSSYAFSNW